MFNSCQLKASSVVKGCHTYLPSFFIIILFVINLLLYVSCCSIDPDIHVSICAGAVIISSLDDYLVPP